MTRAKVRKLCRFWTVTVTVVPFVNRRRDERIISIQCQPDRAFLAALPASGVEPPAERRAGLAAPGELSARQEQHRVLIASFQRFVLPLFGQLLAGRPCRLLLCDGEGAILAASGDDGFARHAERIFAQRCPLGRRARAPTPSALRWPSRASTGARQSALLRPAQLSAAAPARCSGQTGNCSGCSTSPPMRPITMATCWARCGCWP